MTPFQLLLIPILTPLLFAAAYTSLSDTTLQSLPSPGTDYDIHNGALLAPILITRVPGTEGSTKVLNHFIDFFQSQLPQWRMSFQNSTQLTALDQFGGKEVPFKNLILTRDPPWAKEGEVGRLALVAHYDSKVTPKGFIGATDSAAPCAMLMHVARSIDEALTKKWEGMEAEGLDGGLEEEKGVQIILLDGEEAFVQWSGQDSLYGSRSLAEEWEHTQNPAMSTYHNPLSSISLFLLLDLLGSENPRVPSYFKTTHWAYRSMALLESRLRGLGNFKSSPNHPSKLPSPAPASHKRATEPAFLPDGNLPDGGRGGGGIADDHLPFMARGVEILHMIPSPFPRVWHEMDDDGEHLDLDTVEDWGQLVMAFAAEWMELEGFMPTAAAPPVKREHEEGKRKPQVSSKTEL